MNTTWRIFAIVGFTLGGCNKTPPSAAEQKVAEPPASVTSSPSPQADAAPKQASRTFLPSRDGFAFRNSFTGSPLPKALRGLAAQIGANVPKHYGLCGGMSSAAADYFFAGKAPPSDTKPPEDGTVLYNYLYKRQVDSFGSAMANAAKVARWMGLSDTGADSVRSRSNTEFPLIRSQIEKDGVALVFLVYGGPDGKTPLWENHQVLAYAATDESISIYDPNYPGDDTAQLAISKVADGITIERRTARGTKAVRGIFLGNYEKCTPPG